MITLIYFNVAATPALENNKQWGGEGTKTLYLTCLSDPGEGKIELDQKSVQRKNFVVVLF